jgi:hypothetical protein
MKVILAWKGVVMKTSSLTVFMPCQARTWRRIDDLHADYCCAIDLIDLPIGLEVQRLVPPIRGIIPRRRDDLGENGYPDNPFDRRLSWRPRLLNSHS